MNNDTNETGAAPARPKRSPGPVRIAMAALVVAAAVYFWPQMKSMSPDTDDSASATDSDIKTAGPPFDAELSIGEISKTTISYTIETTFRTELTSLHYEIQLKDAASDKLHDVPSGSCQSNYADNMTSRTCISPVTSGVNPGQYTLLVTLSDTDDNNLTIQQDAVDIP